MAVNILTKDQAAILQAIGKNSLLTDRFYLTGGTALAAFYLHHRYSDDLDFFSEQEVDTRAIYIFFKKLMTKLDIKKIDLQQSFNRNLFFLHLDSGVLKTEFTYFPFPRIEKGHQQYGVDVDSLYDIAVNKLFTIYQRTRARDYIDLYAICQQEEHTIAELIRYAKVKFDWHVDPIQLGTQFVKAAEAPDMPNMLKKIRSADWQGFFLEEAKKLQGDIFES